MFVRFILSKTAGEGVDVVIDAAGAEEVIANAMDVIRPEGRIVKIAWEMPFRKLTSTL